MSVKLLNNCICHIEMLSFGILLIGNIYRTIILSLLSNTNVSQLNMTYLCFSFAKKVESCSLLQSLYNTVGNN